VTTHEFAGNLPSLECLRSFVVVAEEASVICRRPGHQPIPLRHPGSSLWRPARGSDVLVEPEDVAGVVGGLDVG
jgi:hypothetical protein